MGTFEVGKVGSSGYITVTPEMARRWLECKHHKQRNLSRSVAIGYAQVMKRGEWSPNTNDAVVFDANGLLINGMHRLAALVMADTPVVLLCACVQDDSAWTVIDSPLRRTAAQFIELPQAGKAVTAAKHAMWNLENEAETPIFRLSRPGWAVGNYGRHQRYDMEEVVEFCNAYAPHLRIAISAGRVVQAAIQLSCAVHSGVVASALIQGADERVIQEWVEGVAVGSEMPVNDPRLVLRNRVLRDLSADRQHKSTEIRRFGLWQYIARAMNAYLAGEPISKLQMSEAPVVIRKVAGK